MRDYLDDPPIRLRRSPSQATLSRRPFFVGVLLLICAAVLLTLDRYGMLTPARQVALDLASPVTYRLTALRDAGADLFGGFGSASEVAQLRQEISQLKAELIRREQAQIENVHLRQQLAIQQRTPWKLLGAEVAVRSPDGGRRMLTITRGSRHGLVVGMAVVAQTGSGPAALIGVVEAVSSQTAQVLLITDVASLVSAQVLHDSQASLGLVQGQWQRGSRLKLVEIERDVLVAPGDTVISAGLSESLGFDLEMSAVPAELPIGFVESVSIEGNKRYAELRPYADPDQVRYVWVVLETVEPAREPVRSGGR